MVDRGRHAVAVPGLGVAGLAVRRLAVARLLALRVLLVRVLLVGVLLIGVLGRRRTVGVLAGGREQANAGKIMGIIGTVLLALGILLLIGFIGLVVASRSVDVGPGTRAG